MASAGALTAGPGPDLGTVAVLVAVILLSLASYIGLAAMVAWE